MSYFDFSSVLQWWIFLFFLGFLFLPITTRLFSSFPDKGFAFSKIIGIIFISYFTFLLGIFHVLPFTRTTLVVIVVVLAILQLYRFKLSPFKYIRTHKVFFLIEELLFLGGLVLWTYVRGFAPEIHGLEKYMDYGFINSILRTEYFPPKDMWLTPHSINYYYFGHLVTAVLTKLSNIPSQITYNLMLGTIVGLTLTSSFSIGATLVANFSENIKKSLLKIIIAGIITGLLVTFAGNLHTIYTLYKPYPNESPAPFWKLEFTGVNPCYKEVSYKLSATSGEKIITCSADEQKLFSLFPNAYWYPNATRFIHNTIHEFPIYSWVVADLHGHVLDIPVVLLAIAFSLSILLKSRINGKSVKKLPYFMLKLQKIINFDPGILRPGDLVFAGFLTSIMYMTNAWDGMIYLLLFGLIFFIIFWHYIKATSLFDRLLRLFPKLILSLGILFLTFIIFVLPFSLHFNPSSIVGGIGVICAPKFLVAIERVGPLLFEADHCQRSPFWQLLILYGFFYFFIISFIVFLINAKKRLMSDNFILALIFLSTLLIVIPEFFYLKDIYPDHYRANTMFKLVFQAFIMLSVASGYIIVRITSSIKNQVLSLKSIFYVIFILISLGLLSLVFVYPFQATKSYYGNLTTYKGVDGTQYLKDTYPDDFAGILWLNENIKGQPVILEAQGDSYTDYARVSSNTGLPTVLGWTVHEWLWRGSYDVPAPRIAEIQTIYETGDIDKTRKLIAKYKIEYVFIGNLEREKYSSLNEEKFGKLGNIIFQKGETKIYKINLQ